MSQHVEYHAYSRRLTSNVTRVAYHVVTFDELNAEESLPNTIGRHAADEQHSSPNVAHEHQAGER